MIDIAVVVAATCPASEIGACARVVLSDGGLVITIVDYNGGNLRSVKRACDAVGIEAVFTQDPDRVARAERVIFPGVGHAKTAMDTIDRTGLGAAVKHVFERGVPLLGICVGAQLLLDGSDEGPTHGLGFLPGQTRLLEVDDPRLKIPHIGWNAVQIERPHPLLAHLQPNDELYFVHSYYLDPADPKHCYATTEHGRRFCCAIGRDNLFATQFHPEKSARLGLELLASFARWEGTPC
jgi:glutamine amidotransferase